MESYPADEAPSLTAGSHSFLPERLGRRARFVYNAPLRPSDGMADVAVSKTVVERRASSNLASGTISIPERRSGVFFLFCVCESLLTDAVLAVKIPTCAYAHIMNVGR